MAEINYITAIDDDISILHISNRKKENFEIIIDTEDTEKIKNCGFKWNMGWNVIKGHRYKGIYYVKASKYLGIIEEKPRYESIYLHRFILGISERFVLVDHINRNSLDNRKSNLRITNFGGNTKNRRGENVNNTSGERNVSLINGWYVVQIQVDGKNTVLGKFSDIEQAKATAGQARQKYYGDYSGDSPQ